MAKGATRDRRRETRWRRLVRQCERSGVTVRQFCRENDLPESAFYYWRRELCRRQAERGEQEQGKCPSARAAFVPVTVTQETRLDVARIEIELSGGQRVHVTAPVDRQALADVLAVLRFDELTAPSHAEAEAQPC